MPLFFVSFLTYSIWHILFSAFKDSDSGLKESVICSLSLPSNMTFYFQKRYNLCLKREMSRIIWMTLKHKV